MLGVEPGRQHLRWLGESWRPGGRGGARLYKSLQQGAGNLNNKRWLLRENKIFHMRRFRDLLCMGRCKHLACWNHFFPMHLAIWGQSCFLYCSHTNSWFTFRDGKSGQWPTHPPSQLLCTSWRESRWWLPNSWLCFTWAWKFACGKGLFTVEHKIENISFQIALKVLLRSCLNQSQGTDRWPDAVECKKEALNLVKAYS